MTVKEAYKYIEKIDETIVNHKKIISAPENAREYIEDKGSLTIELIKVSSFSIDVLMAYKNHLKEKINNTKID